MHTPISFKISSEAECISLIWRFENNLNLTKGLIFSQEVQSLIANKSGLPREEAYKLVRDIAQQCWDDRSNFFEALWENLQIRTHVTKKELKSCFDLKQKIKYVDYIFEKVFGK